MSHIFDKETNKGKCQKFTPEEMVYEMLDLAGYSTNVVGKTVLENSFGSGNILEIIVRRYIERCIQSGVDIETISSYITRDVWGIELDKDMFNACVERLNSIAGEYGIYNVQWSLFNENALTFELNIKFDFIIGNPPYIAYRDIDKDSRDYLKQHFFSCAEGKFDYCYAFIEKSIQLLSPSGKLVQLVPSNIYKTVCGKNLRKLLLPHISAIIEYPNKKLFGNTLTSNTLFLYDISCTQVSIDYLDSTEQNAFSVDRSVLKDKWIFEELAGRIEYVKRKEIRFGDCFHASIAVATLLNEAFVLTPEQLVQAKIEKKVIRQAASPKMLRRKKMEYIIFPYFYDNGRLHHYSTENFTTLFPRTSEYLKKHKDKLANRDSDSKAEWFEYGRSQALSILNQKKLLISTVVTNKIDIYQLDVETIPYSGIFITVKNDQYTLEDAVRILQDPRFLRYVNSVGISISGKSKRITCKDVNNYRFVEE